MVRISWIERLPIWAFAMAFVLIGLVTYSWGLKNSFSYDDYAQIVDAVPVHSISNIKLFFEGGTFYGGNGLEPMMGSYYRPIMSTVFSAIYTAFGANPVPYHVVQLAIFIGMAFLLFLFFRIPFSNTLASILSLIVLVHPINSQIIYAIPTIQDALFMLFGMAAIYILFRFKSKQSLIWVALCLLLSLLSKESGILFSVMALVYLIFYDRPRLKAYVLIMILPAVIYAALRLNAVGFINNPGNAPLSHADIGDRLMTWPSTIVFYFAKLIAPIGLASAYYWVHTSFSVQGVLLPMLVAIGIFATMWYIGLRIKREASKQEYFAYIYFAIWFGLGMLMITPINRALDMTACETWFIFPMVGLLGMIGVAVSTLDLKRISQVMRDNSTIVLIILLAILLLLAVRTAFRAQDWKNASSVAWVNIKNSKENYIAYNQIAIDYFNQKDFSNAKMYASQSIDLFPYYGRTYNILGRSQAILGEYKAAATTYDKGLSYEDLVTTREAKAAITTVYGDKETNRKFLQESIQKYPNDPFFWEYLAVLEYEDGNVKVAKDAIRQALILNHGASVAIPILYDRITNGKDLNFERGAISIPL